MSPPAVTSGRAQEFDAFDDVSVSDLVHRIRRRWAIVVVAAAVGALVVALLATGATSSYRREVTIRFGELGGASRALGMPAELGARPLVTPEAARIAALVAELRDDDRLDAAVRAAPNSAAGSVTVAATGDDEAAVGAALDTVVEEYRTEFFADRVGTVELLAGRITSDLAELDSRIAELRATVDGGAATAAEIELFAAEQRRQELTGRRADLETLAAVFAEQSLQLGRPSDSSSSSSSLSPVRLAAGAVIGAGIGVGAIVLLALIDRKVRRRQQIVRVLPGVPVLGVLPTDPDDDAVDDLGRALRRVHGAGAPGGDGAIRPVLLGAAELPAAVARQPGLDAGAESRALVVVAAGSITEDELSATAQRLVMSGVDVVGVVLTDVPRADLAWAGAGFDPGA